MNTSRLHIPAYLTVVLKTGNIEAQKHEVVELLIAQGVINGFCVGPVDVVFFPKDNFDGSDVVASDEDRDGYTTFTVPSDLFLDVRHGGGCDEKTIRQLAYDRLLTLNLFSGTTTNKNVTFYPKYGLTVEDVSIEDTDTRQTDGALAQISEILKEDVSPEHAFRTVNRIRGVVEAALAN